MPEPQQPALTPRDFGFDGLFATSAGEPLPSDAPGTDRVDNAIQERERSYKQADDLNWLIEGTQQAQEPQEPEAATEDEPEPPGLAGAILRDVGRGAAELPAQVVGGFRDAAQSVLDLGNTLEEMMPLGGGQIFDAQGNFDPRFLSSQELAADRAEGESLELPGVREPTTITGGAVRGISQFLAGFGVAGKAIGGLSGATKIGTVARTLGAGAASDFFAFEGQQERLSNLIQEFPTLQNPVTDYLAAKPDDSEIEGRLKNAVEGLGLGAASGALFKGLRAYKAMRMVARGKDAAKRVADTFRYVDEEQTLREAGEMGLVGRATDDAPLVVGKAKKALAETETGVPTDVAARALTTRGLTPMDAAGDVYVNFAKINQPEDIQRIIKDTSSAFAENIDEARRGVRTNAQTVLSAQDMDAWNILLTRRTGQPLNAEQSVAARELWGTAANKLGEVANIAAQTPTPENLFQFRRMLATFHAVQKEVIGARTETARALQSWAIPVGGNLERMRDMTEALQQSGGLEESASLARRFASLAGLNDGKAAAMANLAEKTFLAKATGAVQEYWINALLSGPKTHIVNMLSNAGVLGLSVLERGVASKLGPVFRDASEAGVEIGEAVAMMHGMRGGIIDAFRNAGKALRTGESGFGTGKIELPRQRYISSGTWNVRSDSWGGRAIDGIGAVTNTPARLMQAEDEFFKTMGYRHEIHAQAARTVSREMRQGKLEFKDAKARYAELLDNPPEAMRMDAVANAAYQTFTSAPGPLTKMVQGLISKFPAAKFILPFTNTPANILKYTFERTPLAPLMSRYKSAIAQGGAAADLARTKMALGTAGLLYAIDLGLNGVTTGSGPSENPSEMQNWRRQGNQPYSVKLGDKSVAFNRLDPLGYHLGMGADLAEFLMNAEASEDTPVEWDEAFAAAVLGVAENTLSKSYMEGLASIVEAVQEPERFGPRWMEQFAGSFVPAGVAEVARQLDPVQRQSHNIVTAMKRRSPGFSSDLPQRRDLWGRPMTYQSGFGTAYDTFSPLYGATMKPEPIDQLMQKDGWFLGMGGNSFTIDGEQVGLKNMPEVRSRFYELRGATKPSAIEADNLLDKYGDATLLETLNAVVTGKSDLSPDFEELETQEDREDFVRDIFNDYSRAARKRLFEEYPELSGMSARKKALRNQQ